MYESSALRNLDYNQTILWRKNSHSWLLICDVPSVSFLVCSVLLCCWRDFEKTIHGAYVLWLRPPASCFSDDVSSLTVTAEGWKKQSVDDCCCRCRRYGVTFFGVVCHLSVADFYIIIMFWRTPFGSSCGGSCWLLAMEGVVGFSPWRELLASCHGGSCCLRTVEEVVSLALWKKSLPLHPGGYHWPGAMEGALWTQRYGRSYWIHLENRWLCCLQWLRRCLYW